VGAVAFLISSRVRPRGESRCLPRREYPKGEREELEDHQVFGGTGEEFEARSELEAGGSADGLFFERECRE
jgi:hypothetical protein